jgi:UDP-GlcNAc:undecaprenyl-phosphate GlcNAc-1-phosphate transferase
MRTVFMNFLVSSTSFIFESILLSCSLAAGFALFSIRVTKRLGLLDIPHSAPHKLHNIPMPLAGGIALFSALTISEWILGDFNDPDIVATFVAGLLILLVGLWDDFKEINPLIKIVGQFLAATVLIKLGIAIHIFESPEFFLGGSGTWNVYLDWILTVLWVVGITNAFNFVDSMDGLAVGLGGMAAAFFMLVTLASGQLALSQHSALLLGACFGLYFFNSPPAQLFLGDSGSQVLGFILASLAIAYRPQGASQSSSWFVPIMLLGVPIFDTVLVVFSRLRRGRTLYAASRDHTYHRLLALGLSSNRAVLLMQVVALMLGCIAFVVLIHPPIIANGIFAVSVFLGLTAIIALDNRKLWP